MKYEERGSIKIGENFPFSIHIQVVDELHSAWNKSVLSIIRSSWCGTEWEKPSRGTLYESE